MSLAEFESASQFALAKKPQCGLRLLTQTLNLKKPLQQDIMNFVCKAWASVSEEVVARSFNRCEIFTAPDGSEDCRLHKRLALPVFPSTTLPTTSDHVRYEVIQ